MQAKAKKKIKNNLLITPNGHINILSFWQFAKFITFPLLALWTYKTHTAKAENNISASTLASTFSLPTTEATLTEIKLLNEINTTTYSTLRVNNQILGELNSTKNYGALTNVNSESANEQSVYYNEQTNTSASLVLKQPYVMTLSRFLATQPPLALFPNICNQSADLMHCFKSITTEIANLRHKTVPYNVKKISRFIYNRKQKLKEIIEVAPVNCTNWLAPKPYLSGWENVGFSYLATLNVKMLSKAINILLELNDSPNLGFLTYVTFRAQPREGYMINVVDLESTFPTNKTIDDWNIGRYRYRFREFIDLSFNRTMKEEIRKGRVTLKPNIFEPFSLLSSRISEAEMRRISRYLASQIERGQGLETWFLLNPQDRPKPPVDRISITSKEVFNFLKNEINQLPNKFIDEKISIPLDIKNGQLLKNYPSIAELELYYPSQLKTHLKHLAESSHYSSACYRFNQPYNTQSLELIKLKKDKITRWANVTEETDKLQPIIEKINVESAPLLAIDDFLHVTDFNILCPNGQDTEDCKEIFSQFRIKTHADLLERYKHLMTLPQSRNSAHYKNFFNALIKLPFPKQINVLNFFYHSTKIENFIECFASRVRGCAEGKTLPSTPKEQNAIRSLLYYHTVARPGVYSPDEEKLRVSGILLKQLHLQPVNVTSDTHGAEALWFSAMAYAEKVLSFNLENAVHLTIVNEYPSLLQLVERQASYKSYPDPFSSDIYPSAARRTEIESEALYFDSPSNRIPIPDYDLINQTCFSNCLDLSMYWVKNSEYTTTTKEDSEFKALGGKNFNIQSRIKFLNLGDKVLSKLNMLSKLNTAIQMVPEIWKVSIPSIIQAKLREQWAHEMSVKREITTKVAKPSTRSTTQTSFAANVNTTIAPFIIVKLSLDDLKAQEEQTKNRITLDDLKAQEEQTKNRITNLSSIILKEFSDFPQGLSLIPLIMDISPFYTTRFVSYLKSVEEIINEARALTPIHKLSNETALGIVDLKEEVLKGKAYNTVVKVALLGQDISVHPVQTNLIQHYIARKLMDNNASIGGGIENLNPLILNKIDEMVEALRSDRFQYPLLTFFTNLLYLLQSKNHPPVFVPLSLEEVNTCSEAIIQIEHMRPGLRENFFKLLETFSSEVNKYMNIAYRYAQLSLAPTINPHFHPKYKPYLAPWVPSWFRNNYSPISSSTNIGSRAKRSLTFTNLTLETYLLTEEQYRENVYKDCEKNQLEYECAVFSEEGIKVPKVKNNYISVPKSDNNSNNVKSNIELVWVAVCTFSVFLLLVAVKVWKQLTSNDYSSISQVERAANTNFSKRSDPSDLPASQIHLNRSAGEENSLRR